MTSTPPDYSAQQRQVPGPPPAPAYQTPQAGYAPAAYQEKPVPVNTKVSDLNAFALVSIIVTFLVPVAGIIFGHIALSQIKRTGDAGRGIALTAVIYGYVVFVSAFILIFAYISLIFTVIGIASQDFYY